jgi:hypothetical protein
VDFLFAHGNTGAKHIGHGALMVGVIRRAGVQKKFILFGPQSPLEAGCKRTRIGSPLPVAGGPRFLGGVPD